MKEMFKTGIFWLLIAVGIALLVMYMATRSLTWEQSVFVIVLYPLLLMIVNTSILTEPQSIAGQDFIEMMKHISTQLHDVIMALFKSKEREQ
jgi:cell division protein FtsW (lipid II flippase)